MGRKSKEGYRLRWKRGIAYVRVTYQGKFFDDLYTGARDEKTAHEIAAQIFTDIVSGRFQAKRAPMAPAATSSRLPLEDLTAAWLDEFAALHPYSDTAKVWKVYVRKWLKFFRAPAGRRAYLGDISSPSIVDYSKWLLRNTKRTTVVKERSALRVFLAWCVEKGYLSPQTKAVFEDMPRAWTGRNSSHPAAAKRKQATVKLSRADVARVIAQLPERSDRKGPRREELDPAIVARIREFHGAGMNFERIAEVLNAEGVPRPKGGQWFRSAVRLAALDRARSPAIRETTYLVRDRVIVQYETSLRPSTISRLSVPLHYRAGAETLTITDSIDKVRFGRTLRLTRAARQALERAAPSEGVIFGKHDLRRYLRAAAVKAGVDPDKAQWIAPYDLRHARATHLLDMGAGLRGTAYNMGHKKMTTLNRYINEEQEAGERAIELADAQSVEEAPQG